MLSFPSRSRAGFREWISELSRISATGFRAFSAIYGTLNTTTQMKTSHQQRLPIEEYALLTENAPELGAKLD